MANVLIACAVSSAGAAAWQQWFDDSALERGPRQAPVIRLQVTNDASSTSPALAPERNTIVGFLRKQLPAGRIDLLQVAVIVEAKGCEPALEALATVLAAVSGIGNFPTRISVLLLAPDAALRTAGGTQSLHALLASVTAQSPGCWDVCLLREEVGNPVAAGRQVVHRTVLRAALHPLWAEETGSRQPLASLQGLQAPYRDSVSCRLFFDRPAWQCYAACDLGRRLANFVQNPVPRQIQVVDSEWLRGLVGSGRNAVIQATVPKVTPPPRPPSLFTPSPAGTLSQLAKELGEQARRSANQALARAAEPAYALVASEIERDIDEAAKGAANELEALAHAFQRHQAILAEWNRQRQSGDTADAALRKAWIGAFNQLHTKMAPSLSVASFNCNLPDSWQIRLAEWRLQRLAISAMNSQQQGMAGYVAALAEQLMPMVLGELPPATQIWSAIVKPMAEALARQEATIADLLAERLQERERTDKAHPPVAGAISQFVFGPSRNRRLRRALAACDRKYANRLAAVHAEGDALLTTTAKLWELAARQECLALVDQRLSETIQAVAAPMIACHVGFQEHLRLCEQQLADVPEGPQATADHLELLTKSELASLAAQVDPKTALWLAEARDRLRQSDCTWLAVAQTCLASIHDWSTLQAHSFQVDLPQLLDTWFPYLTDPRLAQLATMLHALLLPLRHRNADGRRLHQEWHVPSHPKLLLHPAFKKNIVSDDIASTAPTTTVHFTLDDRDRLELHLHLLGFKPPDIQMWNLFAE